MSIKNSHQTTNFDIITNMIRAFKREEFHTHDRQEWNENLIDFTVIKLLDKISQNPHLEYKNALQNYVSGKIGAKWEDGNFWYCVLEQIPKKEINKE